MARTLAQIITSLDEAQAAQSGLSTLNSPSNSAIYTLWKYIVAVNQYLQETLWDIFKTELETTISKAPTGSLAWLQDKIFKFQYSSTSPQATSLVDFVPTYATVDESLRIITRCAVKTSNVNTVEIKVAKSEPPVALSTPELNALKGYLGATGDGTQAGVGVGIGFGGVYYNVFSYTADKLFIEMNVDYNGQFASSIQANVEAAINEYLANIPFDGNIKVIGLIDAIQKAEGVIDVVIENLAIRADTTPFASKTYLIQNFTTIFSVYPIYAGYAVEETETSQTFADKITYTAK